MGTKMQKLYKWFFWSFIFVVVSVIYAGNKNAEEREAAQVSRSTANEQKPATVKESEPAPPRTAKIIEGGDAANVYWGVKPMRARCVQLAALVLGAELDIDVFTAWSEVVPGGIKYRVDATLPNGKLVKLSCRSYMNGLPMDVRINRRAAVF